MDDKTKTVMLTMAAGALKKGLLVVGTSIAGHGWIAGNQIETFVAVGMVLASGGYSFWQDYGKAILISQMDVLKAKSLAQAAKMRDAGVAPVTVTQIANQSPTLTPAEVAKTVATLPPAVQASVAKVAAVALLLLAMGFPGDAGAQNRLTGNPIADIKAATAGPRAALTGSPLNDILGALDDKLLPDLQYALKLATASGSKVTAPCYQAWIDIIVTRQKAVTNADGTPMDLPQPRLITDFEKAVEVRNALQPESEFMRMCSPVANMIKQDMIAFIGKILAGGVGLAALGL